MRTWNCAQGCKLQTGSDLSVPTQLSGLAAYLGGWATSVAMTFEAAPFKSAVLPP